MLVFSRKKGEVFGAYAGDGSATVRYALYDQDQNAAAFLIEGLTDHSLPAALVIVRDEEQTFGLGDQTVTIKVLKSSRPGCVRVGLTGDGVEFVRSEIDRAA